MSCSIGLGDSLSCHDERFTKNDFTTEEWNLILIRSRTSSGATVCLNHKLKYLNSFTAKRSKCCDPLGCHKQKVAGVHVIDLDQYYKVMKVQCEFKEAILPGYALCKRCHMKLLESIKDIELDVSETSPPSTQSSSQSQETRDVVQEMIQEAGSIQNIILPSVPKTLVSDSPSSTPSSSQADNVYIDASSISNVILGTVREELEISQDLFADEDEAVASSQNTDTTLSGKTDSKDDDFAPSPRDAVIDKLNASLVPLGESPVIKRRLTSPGPCGQNKLLRINEKIETLMTSAGSPPPDKSFEELFYEKTLSALKEKFTTSTTIKDKICVLSIALVSLTHRAVLSEFGPLGATDYMLKKTAKLVEEQGLLPTPEPQQGHSLSDHTVQLITSFYEDCEVSSRQMPGKKDFVSVKERNTRVHKQKRLILCTLKELYVHFKERFPSVKIGFSKFASLRPNPSEKVQIWSDLNRLNQMVTDLSPQEIVQNSPVVSDMDLPASDLYRDYSDLIRSGQIWSGYTRSHQGRRLRTISVQI